MTLNTIYTDTEYLTQGFTEEELPLIKRFDTLHNELVIRCDYGEWGDKVSEEEGNEYNTLVKLLGL